MQKFFLAFWWVTLPPEKPCYLLHPTPTLKMRSIILLIYVYFIRETLKGLTMRVVLHYLFAAFVLTIYGGQV